MQSYEREGESKIIEKWGRLMNTKRGRRRSRAIDDEITKMGEEVKKKNFFLWKLFPVVNVLTMNLYANIFYVTPIYYILLNKIVYLSNELYNAITINN